LARDCPPFLFPKSKPLIETQTTFRIALFWLIIAAVASGQGTEQLTGKPFRFEMAQPGTIFWTDSPLQQAVAGLTQTRRVPIWLDRRCDPTSELSFVSQEPLNDCLWKLDESTEDLDIAWSSEMIYFGTKGSADRWATVTAAHRDMIKKRPKPQRQRYLAEKKWSWPRLTNPQELLRQLEKEWGSSFQGRERLHHDLWPAANYSALPFFVRLELLLSGFDLSFDFDEVGNPRIREMPRTPRVTRRIKITDEHRETLNGILKKHPQASLISEGTKLTASWVVHEQLRRATESPKPTETIPRHRMLYTLHARDQKLGPFLEQLTKQLQMKCEFSPQAKKKYDKMISFEVEQASFRELLTAMLKGTNLQFTLSGDVLEVRSTEE